MEHDQSLDYIKSLSLNRKLLVFAGSIYLMWWFMVEMLLPGSFNPLGSRLFVVITILSFPALSYMNVWFQRHLKAFFIFSMWLITLHYYYLFYYNGADINWIVGSYITVIAINLGLLSNTALFFYSCFVILLSSILVFLLPALTHSVFLPGLVTLLFQANMGLRSRLSLIKNLTESNNRFQLLFNSAFEGILVHEKGIILDANDALLKMLKYSRQELIGAHLLTLIHPDKREEGAKKIGITDLGPYETLGLTKENTTISVEIRAKDFAYNKLPARLVTILDISDRKQAEKEHTSALALAENLRIRDEFISIASHELKTPISSLQLQVQIIERSLKKNVIPEKLLESVALFNRQIHRLTELIETMLDVSRISAGLFTLELQRIDLSEMVLEMLKTLPNYSTSTIKLDIPEHAYLMGDPNRLTQVFENLLTNAVRYGEGKPISVLITLEENEVVFSVEDHGIGIAPEFSKRIFDRFERAISSKHIAGFGLGLYIARQIVEEHRGSIYVDSRLGAGSIFTVRLPRETN